MNKISPFASIYSKGNYILIFNHLTLARHYMHKKDCSKMLDNEDLIKKGLVIEEGFDKKQYFKKIKEEILKNHQEPRIAVCYLLLTSDCNHDCEYCLIINSTKKKDYMPEETAKKAVRFFKQNADKEIKTKTVYFYGGEPLLNLQALKAAVEEAKSSMPEAVLVLVTNGSLLTKETAGFLARNKVRVSLSIDGPEDLNNKARHSTIENYFNLIIKGFNDLKQAGISPSILCTVSQHNVDHLEEITQFFINRLGAKNINFVFQKRMKKPYMNSKHVARQMIRGYETAKLNGLTVNNFQNRRIRHFLTEIPRVKDCAGYGQQIVITPEGRVGPCHAFWPLGKFLDLTLDSDIKVADHETWKEWNKRVMYNEPRCVGCEAISLCGGGCAFNRYTAEEGIHNIDKTMCGFIKEILNWLVWAYFEHSYDEEINFGDKKLIIKLPSWTDDKRYNIFLKKIKDERLQKEYPNIKKLIESIYQDKERFLLVIDQTEIIGIAYGKQENHIFLEAYKNEEVTVHVLDKLRKLNNVYLTGEVK